MRKLLLIAIKFLVIPMLFCSEILYNTQTKPDYNDSFQTAEYLFIDSEIIFYIYPKRY